MAPVIAKFSVYYLLVPIFFVSMPLMLIVILLLIIFLYKRQLGRKSKPTSDKRIEICMKLLMTLKKIATLDNFYFLGTKDFQMIMSYLRRICTLIKTYPSGIVQFLDDSKVEDEFLKAGREFEKNIVDFVSTKESHTITIKSVLVNYLNIFLAGDLSALPKAESVTQSAKIQKAKFIHYLLLGLYLILPIVVILILKLVFNITLDEYMQSQMKVLYAIWACLGVSANPLVLNSESKDLLMEIIKSFKGK